MDVIKSKNGIAWKREGERILLYRIETVLGERIRTFTDSVPVSSIIEEA